MSVINHIYNNVALTCNSTNLIFRNFMVDFMILKMLKIDIHPPKSPSVSEIIWCRPNRGWMKCNIDGAMTNFSSFRGGVFRDHLGNFVACFAENLDLVSSLAAEINGVLKIIDVAYLNNWNNLWVETGSSLAVIAFKKSFTVP